jgi:hypothetical protein
MMVVYKFPNTGGTCSNDGFLCITLCPEIYVFYNWWFIDSKFGDVQYQTLFMILKFILLIHIIQT